MEFILDIHVLFPGHTHLTKVLLTMRTFCILPLVTFKTTNTFVFITDNRIQLILDLTEIKEAQLVLRL